MLENSDEWSAENYCHEDKIKDEENIEFRTVKQKKEKRKILERKRKINDFWEILFPLVLSRRWGRAVEWASNIKWWWKQFRNKWPQTEKEIQCI